MEQRGKSSKQKNIFIIFSVVVAALAVLFGLILFKDEALESKYGPVYGIYSSAKRTLEADSATLNVQIAAPGSNADKTIYYEKNEREKTVKAKICDDNGGEDSYFFCNSKNSYYVSYDEISGEYVKSDTTEKCPPSRFFESNSAMVLPLKSVMKMLNIEKCVDKSKVSDCSKKYLKTITNSKYETSTLGIKSEKIKGGKIYSISPKASNMAEDLLEAYSPIFKNENVLKSTKTALSEKSDDLDNMGLRAEVETKNGYIKELHANATYTFSFFSMEKQVDIKISADIKNINNTDVNFENSVQKIFEQKKS